MEENFLIILVENKVPGKVKPELAKDVGGEKALDIYDYLLDIVFKQADSLPVDKAVFYSDFIEENDRFQKAGFQQYLQKGEGLSERIYNAFDLSFKLKYKKVLVVTSDCPEITGTILTDAFKKLDSSEVVFGPGVNHGFYLLGMRRLIPEVFERKEWFGKSELTETIQELTDKNVEYCLLKKLSDIDRLEDLRNYKEKLGD